MTDYRKGLTYDKIYGKQKSTIIKAKISASTKEKLKWSNLYTVEQLIERRRKVSNMMRGDRNPSKRPEVAKKISDSLKGKYTKYYYKNKNLNCPECGKEKIFKYRYDKQTNECLSKYFGFCSKSCFFSYRNKDIDVRKSNGLKTRKRLQGKTWEELLGKKEADKKRKSVSKKMREHMTGDKNPAKRPEVAKKISESLKISLKGEGNPFYGKHWGKDGIRKHPKGMKGKKHSLENRAKISKNNTYREMTAIQCIFCNKSFKRLMHYNYNTKKIINNKHFCSLSCVALNNLTNQKYSMTNPEKLMKEILDTLNFKYYYQHFISNIKHKYVADFYLYEKNCVIEVDGLYWHSFDEKKQIDNIRTKEMKNAGYNVLRFKESFFNLDIVKTKLCEI